MKKYLPGLRRRLADLVGLPRYLFAPKPAKPVFICGCGHTGSTLLARILAGHPEVFSVPYETGLFIGRVPAFWGLSKICEEFEKSKRKVWVEKTPKHIHNVALIKSMFPGARFIITTRDSRDVVASLGHRYQDFDRAYRRWMDDSSASLGALSLPDTMLWRLEDLIEDAEGSLRSICDFIGIEYDPALLEYHQKPVQWGTGRNMTSHGELRQVQVNSPIQDTRGRWKTDRPAEFQNKLIKGKALEISQAMGYQLDSAA